MRIMQFMFVKNGHKHDNNYEKRKSNNEIEKI